MLGVVKINRNAAYSRGGAESSSPSNVQSTKRSGVVWELGEEERNERQHWLALFDCAIRVALKADIDPMFFWDNRNTANIKWATRVTNNKPHWIIKINQKHTFDINIYTDDMQRVWLLTGLDVGWVSAEKSPCLILCCPMFDCMLYVYRVWCALCSCNSSLSCSWSFRVFMFWYFVVGVRGMCFYVCISKSEGAMCVIWICDAKTRERVLLLVWRMEFEFYIRCAYKCMLSFVYIYHVKRKTYGQVV